MDITVDPNTPITDATAVANLYDMFDVLITNSNVSLLHTSGGVYQGEWPVLAVVKDTKYQIEIIVTKAGKTIWYTKQEITARINT
jgi:hypothetical protein